jgi:hypothetical protein
VTASAKAVGGGADGMASRREPSYTPLDVTHRRRCADVAEGAMCDPGPEQVHGSGADRGVAGGQTGPTPSREHARNVVTPYVSRQGKRAARRADRRAGMGARKKRTPPCNGADTGRVPGAKASRRPRGLSSRESLVKRHREQGR